MGPLHRFMLAGLVSLTAARAAWPAVSLTAGNTIAMPGDQAQVAITLDLGPGEVVATLQFNLTVVPQTGSPRLTSPVMFMGDLPTAPSLVLNEGLETVLVAWLLPFSPPLSTPRMVGRLVVPVPAAAGAGATYAIEVRNPSATSDGETDVPFAGFSGRLVVAGELADSDADGIPDVFDNCPATPNPNQADTDRDGVGDACNDSDDPDADEYATSLDNCSLNFNPHQADRDGDGIGDVCDPFPDDTDNAKAQCDADLAEAMVALAAATADADGDGVCDLDDDCPDTASGAAVDNAGCSLAQFCAMFDAATRDEKQICKQADWRNDEPVMRSRDADCAVVSGACVPAQP